MKKITIKMQYVLSGIFFLSVKCDDGYPRWQKETNQPLFLICHQGFLLPAKLYFLIKEEI